MSPASTQVGVLLPTRGVLFADNGPPDVSPILIMAEHAEAAGYHSVWVGDSVTSKPRLEPLTIMAALAARTCYWMAKMRSRCLICLIFLTPPCRIT